MAQHATPTMKRSIFLCGAAFGFAISSILGNISDVQWSSFLPPLAIEDSNNYVMAATRTAKKGATCQERLDLIFSESLELLSSEERRVYGPLFCRAEEGLLITFFNAN